MFLQVYRTGLGRRVGRNNNFKISLSGLGEIIILKYLSIKVETSV
jgi:hypothetical protein